MVRVEDYVIEVVVTTCLIFGLSFVVYLCTSKSENVQVADQNKAKKKRKKSKKAKNTEEIQKPVQKKQKNLHKKVPVGKAAYCKYCEVYLLDDEYLENHVKGKKHSKSSRGRDENWYTITDHIVEQEKKLHFTEKVSENSSDDEWTL